MSATNSTTNYALPIFIGTDKPAWLVDWNAAMTAIDAAIKGVDTDVQGAIVDISGLSSTVASHTSSISTISGQITTITGNLNTAIGNINTINSLIGNGTPTTTDQTIIGAINELNANDIKFNTVSVTADGVKTVKQVLQELFTQYASVIANTPSTKKIRTLVLRANARYLSVSPFEYIGGSTIGALNTGACIIVAGLPTIDTIRLQADVSDCHQIRTTIALDGTVTVADSSDSVTTAGSTFSIDYIIYS